jgi:NMD protein affecting ribosome stability and mRNA decay
MVFPHERQISARIFHDLVIYPHQDRKTAAERTSCPHCRHTKKRTAEANVIQIRMTERELELKWVPVSFFVKKIAEKG